MIYGAVALALAGLFWTFGPEIFYKMNKQKFPPKLPYIIWAMPSLATLFVLYNRLKISKESIITYIGQNAIFFYFAQGSSSSLVYFLVVPLKEHLHWAVLMVIIFIINIILAILIARFLKWVDEKGWALLEILRKKTASH